MNNTKTLPAHAVVGLMFVITLASPAGACDFVLGSPSPFPTGPTVCKPGFAPPQCIAIPYDTTLNLAYSGNGCARAAVAKDLLPGYDSIHQEEFANDGFYGNGSSWIAGSMASWIKVDLGRDSIVDHLTFGRDRTGNYDDRDAVTVQVYAARKDKVYASGDDTDDDREYTLVCDSELTSYPGGTSFDETYEVTFPPVRARYIKLVVSTYTTSLVAFDELEVFGVPKNPKKACSAASPNSSVVP